MHLPRITRDYDTPRHPGLLASTVLPLIAAATLALACAPGPDEGEELEPFAATLLDAADEAEPRAAASLRAPTAEPDGVCTLEARPAALIGVVDQHGEELGGIDDEVEVLFTHREADGSWSAPSQGRCIDADCTRWAIGYATPGEYAIGAFACGDYDVGRLRVALTDDGCHVDTVTTRLQLELEPACMSAELVDGTQLTCDSTTPAKPSVIAMTGVRRGDMVIPQPPSELSLRHASDSAPSPMDCLDSGCTTYASREYGVSGEFRLRAELCGEAMTRAITVEPEPDSCGVQTEWVGLYTDAEQCAAFDYTDE